MAEYSMEDVFDRLQGAVDDGNHKKCLKLCDAGAAPNELH